MTAFGWRRPLALGEGTDDYADRRSRETAIVILEPAAG
jgi:hypothetical protein